MEYVNRKGTRYYIFQGKTKTGKPKYYASKRETSEKGERVEALPEGFEVFESPRNATVTVRRGKPSRVLPSERDLVDRLALQHSAYSTLQTVVDGDRIVIFTPDRDPMVAAAELAQIFDTAPSRIVDVMREQTNYNAEMRFTLHDEERRTYVAERYCYRGSVDGWIPIGPPAPLDRLVNRFVGHLGEESFFEL